MKYIISLIISGALIVSGFGQTRNVLVGTNNTVIQPTNFWSADASNARSGLGLGTAATNSASAFQPSSGVLSNLASSNGGILTNIQATNIVGTIPSSNIPTVNLTNISGTLAIASGGTGATNAATARTNLGLGWSALTNTNVTNFRNAIGLGETNDVTFETVNVDQLSWEGNLVFEPETGIFWTDISFENSTNAAITRTNLGLGATWLTNTNVTNFRTAIGLGTTNDVVFRGIEIGGTNVTFYVPSDGTVFEVYKPIWFGDRGSGDNIFEFEDASDSAIVRTNLGLGWSALTNTNAGTGLVSVNTNGDVVSPTNFWQQAPIATTVAFSAPATNSTNTATNSRNLIIQSLSSNIVNTTNTLLLPTNTSTFNGDTAVVIHAGGSGSATAIRKSGSATNLIVLTNFDHAVRFLYSANAWDFYHNLAYVEPIYFSGTNASANAAASRTNLGIGATWLTNTNVTNFRTSIQAASATQDYEAANKAYAVINNDGGATVLEYDGNGGDDWVIYNADDFRLSVGLPLSALTNTNNANFQAAVFATNTAPVSAAQFGDRAAWMEITVQTNGSNVSFRIPLYK